MKYISSYSLLGLVAWTLISSGCSSSSTETDNPVTEEPNLPAKATGVLPINGETCSSYTPVDENDLKVAVLLTWTTAEYADQYLLEVYEDGTVIHSNLQTDLQELVELDRGKTYIWEVTAVNKTGETMGDSYSFTTPGIPEKNYAPYTAEIDMEFDSITSQLVISWVGRDEDNDLLSYDIIVYEEGQIIVEEMESENSYLAPLTFGPGLEYRVEVTSRDGVGNSSISRRSEIAP